MPSVDDFLYNEDELVLSTMIKQNRIAEATRYIARYPIIQHIADVMDPSRSLQVGASPISLQIGENARQWLMINPDRCSYSNASYNGAGHIFSQSKGEQKAAIHHAAASGMTDVVRLLINKAEKSGLADYVNIKDGYGRTPLHYAAIGGHEETMQYLVRTGADPMEREANRSQAPWELINRKKSYNQTTMELMTQTYAANEANSPLETNPLYQVISRNDEEAAKNLAFDERLFVNLDGLVAKAQENNNQALANYLNFVGDLYEIRRNYHISLMSDNISEDQKNAVYVGLLKNSFDLLIRYNSSDANRQYNAIVALETMRLMGAIVNNISYNFREKSYEIIPWQNLESLMYFAHEARRNGKLEELFKKELSNIYTAFTNLRGNLDELNQDGSSRNAAFAAVDRNQFKSILLITDLVSDLRSLERIASFADAMDSIDPTTPMSADRLALLSMVKQLGEFSKHSQQCNNLSIIAKRNFQDVPWKILEGLRDHVAKAPARPKTHQVYDQLFQEADDRMLLRIRADIADIAAQARNAHQAIITKITNDGWDEIIASYYRGENLNDLTADQQQELINDLNAELATITSRKQKEKKHL